MLRPDFSLVAPAVVASWSVETCDPTDAALWSEDNRALGQCVATAFFLHDLFGGELLEAEVRARDGSPNGFHYWNRFPDGTEIDLTLGQFVNGEIVGEPVVFVRPEGPPSHGRSQYGTLARRVTELVGQGGLGNAQG